jgi:hypothetical protein
MKVKILTDNTRRRTVAFETNAECNNESKNVCLPHAAWIRSSAVARNYTRDALYITMFP